LVAVAHGSAISFVMEHVGLGYVDAIEELARGIGLEVPREPQAGEVYQKIAPDLYEVMQTAARYYREQLKSSPCAIDYLKQRGLSGEIAAKFGIVTRRMSGRISLRCFRIIKTRC